MQARRDPSQPSTSQEGPAKSQEKEKRKQKCRFSEKKHEILVKEVAEHQHQLFVISKLPIGRREAIWQAIVDKVNSVAEVRRTVTDYEKCWHNCKCRTKEKLARNQKAALQTGSGSPAPQEDQDELEEMVTAVIPGVLVTGIAGRDSADYKELPEMQGKLQGRLSGVSQKAELGGT
ncbi:hypothetical protein NDU88_012155 [Pleurodeles waltl]|uniref:Myb/SANT-like DNA-binding domain-containing protein n=1 Tax=Pleurodeles waltl TaxID=8319 RepID=A0AAV7QZC8_PLEWA|nr:hypothetical protein NDU88_012155 [Pleurodeles waltl]